MLSLSFWRILRLHVYSSSKIPPPHLVTNVTGSMASSSQLVPASVSLLIVHQLPTIENVAHFKKKAMRKVISCGPHSISLKNAVCIPAPWCASLFIAYVRTKHSLWVIVFVFPYDCSLGRTDLNQTRGNSLLELWDQVILLSSQKTSFPLKLKYHCL